MTKKKIGKGYFYAGVNEGFPLCCIFFFQDVWSGQNGKFFNEYCDSMDVLTKNQGLIMCPNCVVAKLSNN
ncbi:MAG: hypothetical protein KGZ34_04300 [Nitrosarchaeum sp.]|nr:hypothetical protein [Nitrosarchaeum sp.]